MSKRSVAVLIAGFLTVFAAFSIRYSYGILLPEMLTSLSISKTEAGIIYSSYFLAYTITSPILGVLSDKYDTRKLISLFTAILALGTALMSTIGNLFQGSIYFAIAGIGHAACWAPVIALIQQWVKAEKRATAMMIADLGSGVGIVVWSLILPIVIISFDWRAGWLLLGIMGLLIALIDYVFMRDKKIKNGNNKLAFVNNLKSIIVSPYTRICTNPIFWLMGVSYLLIGFGVIIVFTFLTTYSYEVLRFEYNVAAGLIMIVSATGIISKLILAPISDRFGKLNIMLICCILMAFGALLVSVVQQNLWILIAIVIFGFGYGAIWPVFAAASSDYFPMQATGSVVGIWTALLGVGSILGPILSGLLIDKYSSYQPAFYLTFISFLVAFALLVPVRKLWEKVI